VAWLKKGIFFGSAGGFGLRLGAARLNRLKYGARVAQSSSSSGARGCDWATVTGSSVGACVSPRCPIELIFAAVSSYG